MSIVVAMRGMEPEPWIEALRARLPGRDIATPVNADLEQVRYAVTWRHRPGLLRNCPNLAAIFSVGAGVDHVFADPDLPAVPVVRVVDADLTGRMSEWVMLHVLLHHRQQRMYDWQQSEKLWSGDAMQPAARDVRIGIMGMGVLGRDAARKLAMLGFDVAGWARTAKSLPEIETFAGRDELGLFLARTDILVALLPLTPDTRGIIDAGLIRKLARDGRLGGPILLNAGRGGLQVERDILACLDDGSLRAATLDVFEREPLPPESPLWHHPAVTVSPHNAAISEPGAIAAAIAAQIEAFERGEPLANVVDRQAGY